MVGPTLVDIREHIETLATSDGRYYVACGRTGDRPVPATGSRFPDRATARAAARATEQYRSALRRYDPQVPFYDLIVCEESPRDEVLTPGRSSGSGAPRRQRSVRTDDAAPERRELVEFCHRVAGAVFESLPETGYDSVERAVMDTYFELAERVGGLDELCLCLLESLAGELDERLSPAEQAEVLADAAVRLETRTDADGSLDGTLDALKRHGFLESYTHSPRASEVGGGTAPAVVEVSGYALSARNDRLPVLPLTLELHRHHANRPPRSVAVRAVDEGWQLRVVRGGTGSHGGLVRAPIDGVA
jgi:hypothetical protein